jgi:hypothetical protein
MSQGARRRARRRARELAGPVSGRRSGTPSPLRIGGRLASPADRPRNRRRARASQARLPPAVASARNFSLETAFQGPMPGWLDNSRAPGARRRARRLALAALSGVAVLGVAAPPSAASAGQEAMFQDDLQLLYSGADRREATLQTLKAIGVDSIRVFVSWNSIAPNPNSPVRPGFNAANPAAYGAAAWDRYDELVRSATRRGLSVLFTPTSPIPAWASRCRGSIALRRICSPDPVEFARFVTALGTRYSGGYVDENGGGTLPRVSRWSVWNEPNVAIWLQPQYVRRGGRLIPVSAWRYRQLVYALVGGLRASGHGGDQIMAGEMGPIGHTGGSLSRRPVATAEFLRTVFCLTPRGGPLHAASVGCAGRFVPLGINAIAHHPYIQGGSRPPRTPARFDEITISSPWRLRAIRNAAARLGRIRGGLPIYYTEFGFQTNPPDKILGVPLGLQAPFLDESLYMSYRDPSVRGLAQYLLRDDPTLPGFQTGLAFSDGKPKPSLRDYAFPVFVARHGLFVTVFGQVRAAPDGARLPVLVQMRGRGASDFTTLRTVTTNNKGFVLVRLRSRRARWRLLVPPSPGLPTGLISREAQEAIR